MVLREEVRRVSGWQEHHRRLLGRLLLILLATLVIDAVGTFLIYLAERHARGTDIHSIGDAFFFTTVQLLTVSSQIKNPFTPFGRGVDIAPRGLGRARRRRLCGRICIISARRDLKTARDR